MGGGGSLLPGRKRGGIGRHDSTTDGPNDSDERTRGKLGWVEEAREVAWICVGCKGKRASLCSDSFGGRGVGQLPADLTRLIIPRHFDSQGCRGRMAFYEAKSSAV